MFFPENTVKSIKTFLPVLCFMRERRLDREKIEALRNSTRREILEELDKEPDYPASLARKIGASKQKMQYHFNKLKDADLVKKVEDEEVKGGKASVYRPDFSRLIYGEEPETSPLIEKAFGEKGLIVVGSPDQHGEDQVRARDGHLAGEAGIKLGKLRLDFSTVWDTEVVRDQLFDKDLLIIGGVLTNTVTRELNEEFPAYFSGDSFPYREISTPESTYRDPDIGIVSRKDNKILVAGIRNKGTRAAVKAFKKEEIEKDYLVVKGLDLDGDGEIDDYEVIE